MALCEAHTLIKRCGINKRTWNNTTDMALFKVHNTNCDVILNKGNYSNRHDIIGNITFIKANYGNSYLTLIKGCHINQMMALSKAHDHNKWT